MVSAATDVVVALVTVSMSVSDQPSRMGTSTTPLTPRSRSTWVGGTERLRSVPPL
jgi:hypothetical protein